MQMFDRIHPGVGIGQIVKLEPILMDTHAQSSILGEIDVRVV